MRNGRFDRANCIRPRVHGAHGAHIPSTDGEIGCVVNFMARGGENPHYSTGSDRHDNVRASIFFDPLGLGPIAVTSAVDPLEERVTKSCIPRNAVERSISAARELSRPGHRCVAHP